MSNLLFWPQEWSILIDGLIKLDDAELNVLTEIIRLITYVYQPLSTALFCILGYILAVHFHEIRNQIGKLGDGQDDDQTAAQLHRWSVHHWQIFRTVSQLETYFCNVALPSLGCIFILTINRIYVLQYYGSWTEGSAVVLFNIVRAVAQLFAICSVADLIRAEAQQVCESFIDCPVFQSQSHRLKVRPTFNLIKIF